MGSDGGGAAAGRGRERVRPRATRSRSACWYAKRAGRRRRRERGTGSAMSAVREGRRTSSLGQQGREGKRREGDRGREATGYRRRLTLQRAHVGTGPCQPASCWLPWDDWGGPLQSPRRHLAGLRSPGLPIVASSLVYRRRRMRCSHAGSLIRRTGCASGCARFKEDAAPCDTRQPAQTRWLARASNSRQLLLQSGSFAADVLLCCGCSTSASASLPTELPSLSAGRASAAPVRSIGRSTTGCRLSRGWLPAHRGLRLAVGICRDDWNSLEEELASNYLAVSWRRR